MTSSTSGIEHFVPVRIVEKEPGRHVEIHARHLGATLVVRQVGRYLTFASRLPRDIAEQGAGREGLQLCVKGCPLSERIDISGVLLGHGHHHHAGSGSNAHTTSRHTGMPSSGRFHRSQTTSAEVPLHSKGMQRDAALALCREYNLTDYYLDSCMFDLMTTGDPSFSLAASRAQLDFMNLVPEAVHRLANRTWPHSSASSMAAGSSSSNSASLGSLSSSASSPLLIREAHGPGRPLPPITTACLLLIWSVMSFIFSPAAW